MIEPYSEIELEFSANYNSDMTNFYFEIEPVYHQYDAKNYIFNVYRNQITGDINSDNNVDTHRLVNRPFFFFQASKSTLDNISFFSNLTCASSFEAPVVVLDKYAPLMGACPCWGEFGRILLYEHRNETDNMGSTKC